MAFLVRNLSKETMEVIYEKQSELQKKKLRRVSLDQTIDVLIKDAYLRNKDKASNEQNL
jgi:hypothetical protein